MFMPIMLYCLRLTLLLQCSTVSILLFSSPSFCDFYLSSLKMWLLRRKTFLSWAHSEEIYEFSCQNVWVERDWQLNNCLETCVIFDALPCTGKGCDFHLFVLCWVLQREHLFQTEKRMSNFTHPVADPATAIVVRKKNLWKKKVFWPTLLLC